MAAAVVVACGSAPHGKLLVAAVHYWYSKAMQAWRGSWRQLERAELRVSAALTEATLMMRAGLFDSMMRGSSSMVRAQWPR
jgi:hypothetical protein